MIKRAQYVFMWGQKRINRILHCLMRENEDEPGFCKKQWMKTINAEFSWSFRNHVCFIVQVFSCNHQAKLQNSLAVIKIKQNHENRDLQKLLE